MSGVEALLEYLGPAKQTSVRTVRPGKPHPFRARQELPRAAHKDRQIAHLTGSRKDPISQNSGEGDINNRQGVLTVAKGQQQVLEAERVDKEVFVVRRPSNE